MIHQNDGSLGNTQQVPAGDHSYVAPLLIQDREITIPFFRHDFLDLVRIIIQMKGYQIFLFHKELHRHALVDQTGHRIRIQRCHDHVAVSLPGQPLNRSGHRSPKAHHDTSRAHLDGTQLGFITVAQNDHVMLINIILHHIRVGSGNHHLAPVKITVFIPDDHLRIQCLQDILIRRPGNRNNGAVIFLHVGFCNIIDRNKTMQMIFLIRDGKRKHVLSPHQRPCVFNGNITAYTGNLPDLHILYSGSDIIQINGMLNSKMIQNILCFRRYLPCSGSHIAVIFIRLIFQIGIGNGRTDGICIRVFMSHNADCPFFVTFP